MRKSNTDPVTVKVHPAVRRYFENTFPQSDGAFDLRGHFLHDYLRAGLTKEAVDTAEPSPRLVELRVLFSRRDCQRLGWTIPETYQASFSRLAYKHIQQTACLLVLYAHTAGGVPRDTAIKEYLLDNLYEEGELNYAALRKYYQRNWMEAERRVLEELGTMTGGKKAVRIINNCVKNVPIYKLT